MWLGYFVPRRSRDAEEGRDLWCFVPPGDEPSLNRCALGRDAIFVNPLYVTEIEYASPAGIHRTLSVLPIIAEAPVEIPPDLRLVYLMDEWRDDVLRYRLRSGLIEGAPLEPDGSALIQTIIGPVRLRRTDDPDAAIVEVATSITHISVDLDREIVEHRTRVIQSRPYPVVSATTPAPADADFRSIVSGDVILEQEVRPAMVFRGDQVLRDGGGQPIFRRGDLLAGHEVEDGLTVCPISNARLTSCFSDKNDAPGYDYTYTVVREDESALYMRRINQQYVINPVRIAPAPEAVPPQEVLRLTYLGAVTTGDATYARFAWTGATQRDGAYGARSVISVRLDEHGVARLTTNGGDLIGEFRLLGGRAMYRNQGGIPARATQPISRDGQILEMRRAFEAE
jgi:hypothetical protein